MRKSTSRPFAGALLAVLAATLLSPLTALARGTARSAEPHGCHCPVKMACCEAGLCHADADDPAQGSGPSWSGCRDEAPDRTAVPAPSTAFDAALPPASDAVADEPGVHVRTVAADRTSAPVHGPATPPPRASIALC